MEEASDELKANIILKTLEEADGWQLLERSLRFISESTTALFSVVSRHELLTEEGAARFNVFLRVILRDMEMSDGAGELVKEAMATLRERFPGATSEEVSVPLEVMGA